MNRRNGPDACRVVLLCALLSVAGCAGTGSPRPPVQEGVEGAQSPGWAAQYPALRLAGRKVFGLDPGRSRVRILVFRGGRAAKLGHNHVLSAPRFSGFFALAGAAGQPAQFDLEFRLDELSLDAVPERAALGGAFSPAIDPEDIERTREHMLGEAGLQAGRFAFVRVHSLQVIGEYPRFAAQVRIDLHGRSHTDWVALRVEGTPADPRVSGSLVLLQSDFGVQPYSVLGGLLAVQDAVVVEFELAGLPED